MNIKVQDLLKVIDEIKTNIEHNFEDEIEIDPDFYWQIPTETLYDPLKEPNKLYLGQISDDWEELSKLNKGEICISYDLIRLAEILKLVRIKSTGKW